MQKIGIIANPKLQQAKKIIGPLKDWLLEQGKIPYWDNDTALMVDGLSESSRGELIGLVDLVIVLGGDGTLLSVAHLPGIERIPILGVNLGKLGFLTEINQNELYHDLARIIAGDMRIDERFMLSASVIREDTEIQKYLALNEVTVNRATMARIISLNTRVNNSYVNEFRADGLIVATPTGSTAYSLAAGGPIMHPSTEAFIITPICPHTLTNRPLVIPSNSEVEIHCPSKDEDIHLTIDGQITIPLKDKDYIKIKKASQTIKLVQPTGRDYYKILRTKLGWGTLCER